MVSPDPDKPNTAPDQRDWKTWLILRSRPLALAIILFITIIVMLLTGAGQEGQ